MESNDKKAILFASLAVLSWSTVATAFKVALQYLSTYGMLLVACLTSFLIFLIVVTFQKKWGMLKEIRRGQWAYLALMGLLNPVAYYLVLFKAYDLLPAQVAQPINYAWPIVLLVLLALFAGQPIPAKKYIGMFISLAGVALISLGGGQAVGSSLPVSGLCLAALSAVIWATYWMLSNKRKEQFDASVSLLVTFFFGSVYLLAGSLFTSPDLNSVPGVLAGMYVGGFEMGIPFIFFGLAMRKTSNPALINQMCYLSPFLSLFFISMVLGEKIVLTTYLGLALIVAGLVFNEYLVKKR